MSDLRQSSSGLLVGGLVDDPGFIYPPSYGVFSLPLAPHLVGDFDNDQDVDFADFIVLAQNFGTTSGATLDDGDLDGDADVDFQDFIVRSQYFGRRLT